MPCTHERVKLTDARTSSRDGVVDLLVTAVCSDCSAPLIPSRPEVETRSLSFEVRLRAAGLDPGSLRCPRCNARLYGRPRETEDRLDRAPISAVVCGAPHTVVYEDGAQLFVGGGEVWGASR